ncbi:MAG: FkbM family methyltransferase [Actinomycetota bacterium]|nr:FkbM family methyltransferase [Actinomycetota bacterium]
MTTRFGARCVAVEPNWRLHNDIADAGAIEIICAAIGSNEGDANFNVSAKDDSSSLHTPFEVESAAETVRTVRLERLLDDLDVARIDMLKVDIEGMEVGALSGLRADQLARIQQCTVEFHDGPGYVSVDEIQRVTSRMRECGFRCLKMSVHDHSDVLYVRADRCSALAWAEIRLYEAPLRQARRLGQRVVVRSAK